MSLILTMGHTELISHEHLTLAEDLLLMLNLMIPHYVLSVLNLVAHEILIFPTDFY